MKVTGYRKTEGPLIIQDHHPVLLDQNICRNDIDIGNSSAAQLTLPAPRRRRPSQTPASSGKYFCCGCSVFFSDRRTEAPPASQALTFFQTGRPAVPPEWFPPDTPVWRRPFPACSKFSSMPSFSYRPVKLSLYILKVPHMMTVASSVSGTLRTNRAYFPASRISVLRDKRPVSFIGEFHVNRLRTAFLFSDEKEEGIGKLRKQIVFKKRIVNRRLLEKLQAQAVVVCLHTVHFPFQRKSSVRKNRHRQLVIRERVIPGCFQAPRLLQNSGQLFFRKGLHSFCCGIAFQSLKQSAEMILRTSRPVFQPETVLDGKDDLSLRVLNGRQLFSENLQKASCCQCNFLHIQIRRSE